MGVAHHDVAERKASRRRKEHEKRRGKERREPSLSKYFPAMEKKR